VSVENDEELVAALRCTKNENRGCLSCGYQVLYNGRYDYCDRERMEKDAADLIESLTARLAKSQRRERAAVEDMKSIADAYRAAKLDDGICGLCKFDADHGLDGYANECPGYERNNCFQWRGPQDGEGETK